MESGPLFRLSGRQPLTRLRFVEEVRRALQKANLPAKDFAGHSFCIGAATTASATGVEDSMIQTLGRWKSSAFLKFIRASPKHLARVSKMQHLSLAPAGLGLVSSGNGSARQWPCLVWYKLFPCNGSSLFLLLSIMLSIVMNY